MTRCGLLGLTAAAMIALCGPAARGGGEGLAERDAALHPELHPELHGAYYDMSVCEYCGLVTAAVHDGYRREVADLVARDRLAEAEYRAIRIKAWTEADLEYGNRGLGGFRNWCRTEGAAAARRFLDYHARALSGDAGEP